MQPGARLSFEDLIAHLRAQQIASFKLPERLEVMESFPISPAGKILKRELREIVAARIAPRPSDSVRQRLPGYLGHHDHGLLALARQQ